MKFLIKADLLNCVCSLFYKTEAAIFDKIILITIQELLEITPYIFERLQQLCKDIEGESGLFLKYISAMSVSSKVTETALLSNTLWSAIFQHLVSPNTIDRKRALYWLNRALHNCKSLSLPRLSVEITNETLFIDLHDEIINDLLILLDSLEEKQTHVILPVLLKIDNIKKFLNNEQISIHWLLTICERASLHESTVILKWALTEFLNLPINLSSSFFYRILSTSFIKMINQSNLYFSPDGVNSITGFFASFQLDDFINRLFNDLSKTEQTNLLMIDLLDKMTLCHWNSHALLFLAESFSKINLNGNHFSIDVLFKIGSICQFNLVTYNLKYRQCITSFFLTGFFKNHGINSAKITDYINIMYNDFNLTETVIIDNQFLMLFKEAFTSLPCIDCQQIFQTIVTTFADIQINDINFTSIFNKLTCISLISVMLSNTACLDSLTQLISTVIEPIQESRMNPYANSFEILKSIIFLERLHLLKKSVQINLAFSKSVTEAILLVLVDITQYLSNQIEYSKINNDNQITCLSLLKFFIKQFPMNFIDIYFKEHCGNTPVKVLIASNSVNEVEDMLDNLDLLSLLNCKPTENINELQYEKLNCLARYFRYYKNTIETMKVTVVLVNNISDLIDVTVSYKGLIALLNICGSIMEHLYDIDSSIVIMKMVKCLWMSILEHSNNAQIFWKLYTVFLEKVFKGLLKAYHKNISRNIISDNLKDITETIFKVGANKFGLVHLLGEAVHDFLVVNDLIIDGDNCDLYIELIGRLILFGPCHRRGLRFENRIERYLNVKYGDRWKSFRVNKTAESSERVGGLLILCLKRTSSKSFRETMISHLRKKDNEILNDSVKGYKNYANNHVHRTRHRLFSALLIVLHSSIDFLSISSLEDVEQWMLYTITNESLNSIRHLAEWVYIILCRNDLAKQANLVKTLKSTTDSKPAYICSLITICRHVIVFENSLVDDLVMAILPLGTAQNYNIRLYAMTFINIIHDLKLIDCSKQQHHLNIIIEGLVSFVERSTMCRNVKKLMDNFWWTKFDPMKDVCLETIFSVLPPLFDLVEEEIICLDQFESVSRKLENGCYSTKFSNQRSVWKGISDTMWRVKVDTLKMNELELESKTESADVQKKIQPWITCRPDEEVLRELYGAQLVASDLVLVCSLIEKATNIGGLARTSNIFGVGEFVVNNLRIIDDKSFKQLAVTADKWICMTEVAVKALTRFIAVKRSEGYEIVGIEQTANSVSLQSMSFKSKTVLLLGNEKEGIPVELISHMDKCIQIPQMGQIRSLNVHVSGAIVLWEYMKQMKLANN